MAFYPLQTQTYYLAGSGAIVGATTLTLKSMLTIDGASLTMATDFGSIAYATIDPGNNTLEEQISFTGLVNNANGTTTLSGIKSVTFDTPYTETSGLLKTHAGSAPFVISNTSGYYNKFAILDNDETITGQWTFSTFPITPSNSDASTTVKGVTKLSVAPSSATNPIAVGTNDTRVPTADPTTLFAPITTVYTPLASDYSDGNVTISVNTSLSRDMYYDALVVNTGVTLSNAGYRIFARSVTINGTGIIDNSGGAGGTGTAGVDSNVGAPAGGTAGAASSTGTMPGGRAGQIGGAGSNGAAVGSNGIAGTNSTFNINSNAGAAGGAGGAAGGNGGGTAGAGGTNTSTVNPPRDIVSSYYAFDFTSATAIQRYNANSGSGSGGGGGGAAGGFHQGGAGGGSGGSGGMVFIAAKTITNAGTIRANGGAGGAGGSTTGANSGGGGGGGGGNGGVVFLIYATLTNTGTITASGGTGGNVGVGNGTGNNGIVGPNGSAGKVIQITT